ncbi:MAG: hypothetical protein GXO85_16185 [Chlorobi bacterium]|nr:hypothetical protein [Chlorobiota bacterium]
MKLLKTILLTLTIATSVYSQKIDTTKVFNELKGIYSNLEYNTSAFNNMKKRWIISDPELIRNISNRFIANNYVKLNGKNADAAFISYLNNEIYEGRVVISVRKRYFDDEIEYFAFIEASGNDSLKGEKPLFDPIISGFYLRTIIGDDLYNKILDQTYFYTDTSVKKYYTRDGYNFDLYFNLLNSHIMFWSTSSSYQNKYLLSLFEQWGSDEIYFPGWTFQQYFVGAQLTHYKKLSSDERNYTYYIGLGTGIEKIGGVLDYTPPNPLLKSGDNIFLKLSSSIFEKNMFLDFESMVTMNDFKKDHYDFDSVTNFYSIRNYFSLKFRAIKLFDVGDLGQFEGSIGFSTYDMNYYQYDPNRSEIIDLIYYKDFLKRFNNTANLEFGISKIGGLLQHQIHLFIGISPDKYGFYGAKIKFMLSDTFGIDVRFAKSFGLETAKYNQPWRDDAYIVFSPVLRINY